MHHGKEDLQDLAVADLLRIVLDLDRFGMSGRAGADHGVVRGHLAAAGIPGHRVEHASRVLVHALYAPEAAAGDHSGLDPVAGLNVDRGWRNDDGFLRGARRAGGDRGDGQRADGGSAQRQAAEMARGHGFLFRQWLGAV
jgi:hypothetical protein